MIAGGVNPEALAAGAYAVILVLLALGLGGLARYSEWQAHRYHAAGFRYHPAHDMWESALGASICGPGRWTIARTSRATGRRRTCATPAPLKPGCTDSDSGREIEQDLRPWLGTVIGQFHRGMSLVLLLLAGLIALIGLVQHPTLADGIMLAALAVAVGILGGRLYASLRSVSNARRRADLPRSLITRLPLSVCSTVDHDAKKLSVPLKPIRPDIVSDP